MRSLLRWLRWTVLTIILLPIVSMILIKITGAMKMRKADDVILGELHAQKRNAKRKLQLYLCMARRVHSMPLWNTWQMIHYWKKLISLLMTGLALAIRILEKACLPCAARPVS